MKLGFLELPPAERRLYLEQSAIRRNLSPVILEKDFWVCWLLGVLFESEFADSLVFKGGTSLSKVFGVIDRFSEDIDLSLSPEFLNLPEAGATRNQANKWMISAEAKCGVAVRDQICSVLEAEVVGVLGSSVRAWFSRATESCNGRASSSAVHGQTTSRRNPARSDLSHLSSGCPHSGVTIAQCGTCISPIRSASRKFLSR
jgi:Nucleotidyl transferase AbiEii toxin, Type IV TA system